MLNFIFYISSIMHNKLVAVVTAQHTKFSPKQTDLTEQVDLVVDHLASIKEAELKAQFHQALDVM